MLVLTGVKTFNILNSKFNMRLLRLDKPRWVNPP